MISKGRDSFIGNTAVLTGSAAIATGVMVLAEPISSRLFGPEACGMAAIFTAIVQIIGMIGCLRYDVAIVIAGTDEEAASLLGLCGAIAIATTAMTACLTALFGRALLVWLDASALAPVLWVLPMQVALTSVALMLRYWNIRHRRFGLVAAGKLLTGIPTATAEVSGGATGFRTGQNLVVLRAVAQIVAPLFLLYHILRNDFAFLRAHATPRRMLAGARRYMKFPTFDAGSVLLNMASWHAPVVLLIGFFGAHAGGLFTKAVYVLYLPTVLVGESVGQVFLQHSGKARAEGADLCGIVRTVSCQMISLGLMPFAIVALIGPQAFSVVLGARWAEAGVYAGILAPWMFAVLISSSIRFLFSTLELQRWNFASNAVLFVVRITSLLIGGAILKNLYLTLAMFSVSGTMVILWRCGHLMKMVNLPRIQPIKHFAGMTLLATPGLALIAALRWWVGTSDLGLLAAAAAVSISYLVVVAYRDPDLRAAISAKAGHIIAKESGDENE